MQKNFDFNQQHQIEQIKPGAVILKGFATASTNDLLADSEKVLLHSPLRVMTTPNGLNMSAALSNCGECGWVSDKQGYRYETIDPLTQKPWPNMPTSFLKIAKSAAQEAGYSSFNPDACLLNHYQLTSKMGLHQDNDENDLSKPIISVSLGLDAVFLFGGAHRQDPVKRYLLNHGDVVVFGGPARLHYHGIASINSSSSCQQNINHRLNLTFRKVY